MRSWNHETVEKLLALNEQGLSASVMAAALGNGISRNAVIGKLNRLGVGMHNRGEHAPQRKARTYSRPPKPKPVKVDVPAPEPVAFLGEIGQFPADNHSTCRFSKGDTGTRDGWQMCGHPGYPWCDYHKTVVVEPKRTEVARKKARDDQEDYDLRVRAA